MRRFRQCLVALLASCLVLLPVATARAEDRAITVPETPVRSAPFNVAPVIARLKSGDRVRADDRPQGEWRRIVLPDGRYGFVRDADTQYAAPEPPRPTAAPAGDADEPPTTDESPPAAGAAPTVNGAAAPATGPSPPALVRREEPSEPLPGPHLLGVMFEMLPVGTLAFSSNGVDRSADSVFAVGVAPFLDAALSPYFALGISPQVIFRVKSDGAMDESAKQFDVRARLTGRVPVSPKVRVFGRLSPGYSLIALPSPPPPPPGATNTIDRSNPQGFVANIAVGAEIAVLPKLFLVTDLGYQAGFQSSTDGDLHTSYLHLGVGFAIGL